MKQAFTSILKRLTIICLVAAGSSAHAYDNWILLGDSIQSWVIDNGPATALTASRIPALANVGVMNMSRPGARVTHLQKTAPDAWSSSRDGWVVGANCTSTAQCPYDTRFSTYLYRNLFSYYSSLWNAKGVIITLGRNDWGNDTNQLFLDYSEIVQRAKSNGLDVVCVGPIWSSDETATNNMLNVRVVIMWACNNNGGTFVDGYNAVPHDAALYYSTHNAQGQLQIDGVHLNAAGHVAFSNWLVTTMHNLGKW